MQFGAAATMIVVTVVTSSVMVVGSVIVVSSAVFKNTETLVVAAIAMVIFPFGLLIKTMIGTMASEALWIAVATVGAIACAAVITASISVDCVKSMTRTDSAIAWETADTAVLVVPADTSILLSSVEIARLTRIALAAVPVPAVSAFAATT